MRLFLLILVAAVVGTVLGAGWSYYQVGPADHWQPTWAHVSGSFHPGVAGTGRPAVEVPVTVHDFGFMQRGTSGTHEFIFRNTGSAPLKLHVASTTCQCTVGDAPDKEIAPGESVPVQLKWSVLSLPGPFRHSATIGTNDPFRPSVDLIVEGEVVEAVGLSAPDFLLDKISVGETKSSELYLMTYTEGGLEVTDPRFLAEESAELFTAEVEKLRREELPDDAALAGVRIRVTLQPGLPIGSISQTLAVTTSRDDAPELKIPIVGTVVGDISITGTGYNSDQNVLRMGAVVGAVGGKAELNMLVREGSPADLRVEVVRTVPEELVVTIGEPRELAGGLRVLVPLVVEVPPGTRPMIYLQTEQSEPGLVVLRTNHPRAEEIAFRVSFAVQ